MKDYSEKEIKLPVNDFRNYLMENEYEYVKNFKSSEYRAPDHLEKVDGLYLDMFVNNDCDAITKIKYTEDGRELVLTILSGVVEEESWDEESLVSTYKMNWN